MKQRIWSWIYILFIIVTGAVAGYLVSTTVSIYQGYRDVQVLNKRNIYMGNNQITDRQYSKINSASDNTKAQKIFRYLDNNFDYAMSWEKDVNNQTQAITANLKFLNLYNIKVNKGRALTKTDLSAKKIIPVLVGSDLQTKYPIGKEFTLSKQTYKSVGVLTAHSQVPSVYLFQNYWDLDNSLIIPLTTQIQKNLTLSNLANSTQNIVLLDTNQNKVAKLQKMFIDNDMNVRFYTAQSNIADTTAYVRSGLLKVLIGYLMVMILAIIFGYMADSYRNAFRDYLIGGSLLAIIEIILGVTGNIFGISYAAESSGVNWTISILAIIVSWIIIEWICRLLLKKKAQK